MSAEIFLNGRVQLCCGDSLHFLRDQPDNRYDSVVTDPPYALVSIVKRFANSPRSERTENTENPYGRTGRGFMGQRWDNGSTAFAVEFWQQVFRVLKPGGHVVAFGGTRTSHRLTCAIEDAGFEIRDQLGWCFGSGFPKSHNAGNGWGTALKPAWEPISLARKPLGSPTIQVQENIEDQLRSAGVIGEILWKADHVNDAELSNSIASLSSTDRQLAAAISVVSAAEKEPAKTGRRGRGSTANKSMRGPLQTEEGQEPTAEGPTESFEIKSSKPTDQIVNAAENQSETSSRSITSTVAEQHTENQSMGKSTPNCGDKGSQPVTESFAGIATGLTGSMAHVHIRREGPAFLWPNGLPRIVPAKSLTVAQNVLQHGTGAINIDGCRIWDDTDKTDIGCLAGTKAASACSSLSMSSSGNPAMGQSQTATKSTIKTSTEEITTSETCNFSPHSITAHCTTENISAERMTSPHDESRQENAGSENGLTPNGSRKNAQEAGKNITASKGRWPANLLHDGSDEVIAAFPDTNPSTIGKPRGAAAGDGWGMTATGAEYDDSGSAARFFYSAKADSDDRLGSKHPTVKPVDLMQWLVRLVTPKGGLVLDPFAGTGTTAEACFREGMRCMLVERETEYQADIRRRMALVLGGPEERRRAGIKAKNFPIDHGPLFEAAE